MINLLEKRSYDERTWKTMNRFGYEDKCARTWFERERAGCRPLRRLHGFVSTKKTRLRMLGLPLLAPSVLPRPLAYVMFLRRAFCLRACHPPHNPPTAPTLTPPAAAPIPPPTKNPAGMESPKENGASRTPTPAPSPAPTPAPPQPPTTPPTATPASADRATDLSAIGTTAAP